MVITFEELRRVKDALPNGSMSKIANELGLNEDTVRNYFGGTHYQEGNSAGVHIEEGFIGGVVELDDTAIYDKALEILGDKPELEAAGVN